MRNHVAIAIATGLGLSAMPAHASSDALSIGGSVRLRTESIAGQFRATGPENDTMVSLKTALDVQYDAGPVRFGAELWDARSWGQDRASTAGTAEVNALELVQANVKVELGRQSMLTLGRFTLDIGGRRLVSRQRFRNTTNAFTGAHLQLADDNGRRLDAMIAMPQVRLPSDADGIRADKVRWDRESTDLVFLGAQATLPGVAGGAIQPFAYGLTERDSASLATRKRRLWTVGMRLFRQPRGGQWDHDIEAAWQGGRTRRTAAASDTADLAVAAWFIHVELGRTLSVPGRPRIAVLFDGASGDGGKTGRYSRFDTLYGARRFEFGPNGLYGPFTRANVLSPSLRLEVAPTRRTDAFFAWRSAWAQNGADTFGASGLRDASSVSGTLAGHQIEARVRHWIVPDRLQIDLGGAVLLKRGLLRGAPGAPASANTRYGYVDLLLTL